MKNTLKNFVLALAVLLICAAVGLLVGCPIKKITGIPCPGCGMTRACLHALKLDFKGMLFWHPLCPLAAAVGAMFVFKDTKLGAKMWKCTPLLAGIAVLFLAVYAVRMAVLFPYTPPMDMEKNSFFVKILRKILLH